MELSCQKFGLDLLKTICSDDFDKNVIYSPLSIYMALGMTLCGAKGDTSAEMIETLYWDQSNSNLFHQQLSDCIKKCNVDDADTGAIKIANKLFLEIKYELLEFYVKTIGNFYSGGIEKMEFQSNPEKSRQNINLWVEHQTNGKIKDLLQPGNINNLTKLILVNAIYFKGSWEDKFSVIGKKNFHLLNDTVKSTEMMTKTDDYKYLKNSSLGFSAVQIPFKRMQNNEYSFMIILPNDRQALPELERSIFQQQWKSILGDDLFKHSSVHIIMPKFRIECSFSLKNELQNLGMMKPFSNCADFSLMTEKADLMIDDVVHKAFIDIDENGVEAAAATAVVLMECCFLVKSNDPIEFTCDHPFMFALVKQGSLPLFIGHFTQC